MRTIKVLRLFLHTTKKTCNEDIVHSQILAACFQKVLHVHRLQLHIRLEEGWEWDPVDLQDFIHRMVSAYAHRLHVRECGLVLDDEETVESYEKRSGGEWQSRSDVEGQFQLLVYSIC